MKTHKNIKTTGRANTQTRKRKISNITNTENHQMTLKQEERKKQKINKTTINQLIK